MIEFRIGHYYLTDTGLLTESSLMTDRSLLFCTCFCCLCFIGGEGPMRCTRRTFVVFCVRNMTSIKVSSCVNRCSQTNHHVVN